MVLVGYTMYNCIQLFPLYMYVCLDGHCIIWSGYIILVGYTMYNCIQLFPLYMYVCLDGH